MESLGIRVTVALRHEINWVNQCYTQIGFKPSDYDREIIAMAKRNNQTCGLGRLVQIDTANIELGGIYVFEGFRSQGIAGTIVRYLLSRNPYDFNRIWCLPFKHLLPFYAKFGFHSFNGKPGDIPTPIGEKLLWCRGAYPDEVLLLCLEKQSPV